MEDDGSEKTLTEVAGSSSEYVTMPAPLARDASSSKEACGYNKLCYISRIMTGAELRKVRQEAGWTQERLAKGLGLTQAYVSLMEGDKRRVPDHVKRQVTALFGLPPTYLPLSGSPRPTDPTKVDVELEQGLARLGYPGLAYRRRPGTRRNPVDLLLMALSVDDLDARLAEALPWLLLRFEGYDTEHLVAQAKSLDLQNRLGFTVALACRVAERNPLFRDRLDE